MIFIYLFYYSFSVSSLGGSADDYPHPGVDAKGFVNAVKAKNNAEARTLNPVTKKMAPWIEISNMKDIVGGKCIIS